MTQSTPIKIRVTYPYGRELLTPLCDTGLIFARIAGTKSLTRHLLADIKLLGYTVEVVQDEVVL